MLPETTTSELDALGKDEDGAHKVLTKFRDLYQKRSEAHLRYARTYMIVYHAFGGIAVLTAVIISSVDGCAHPDAVLALGMTVAMLTTALNFFGVESRLQKHDTAKRQYELLSMDIEKWLLMSDHLRDSAEDLERACFNKQRIISHAEPDLSLCCIKTKS